MPQSCNQSGDFDATPVYTLPWGNDQCASISVKAKLTSNQPDIRMPNGNGWMTETTIYRSRLNHTMRNRVTQISHFPLPSKLRSGMLLKSSVKGCLMGEAGYLSKFEVLTIR